MPNPSDFNNKEDFMGACVPKMMSEGRDQDQAVAACSSMWDEGAAKAGARNSMADLRRIQLAKELTIEIGRMLMPAVDNINSIIDLCNELGAYDEAQPQDEATMAAASKALETLKGSLAISSFSTVKAVGPDELDVTAIPFGGRDGDGQWFDAETDIMDSAFQTPLAVYQHGIKQGAKGLQEDIIVVGQTVPGSLKKMADGWHLRVKLNMALKEAQAIMAAAWKRMVAVSSGSISHLARLDVGGKRIMYQKNKPGRIAVWPLAEISLWEKGNGNMQPANQMAVALPAMKAIYREAEMRAIYRKAGIPFPESVKAVHDSPEAGEPAASRAKREQIRKRAAEYLARE